MIDEPLTIEVFDQELQGTKWEDLLRYPKGKITNKYQSPASGESLLAYTAFQDWCRMGMPRSCVQLLHIYDDRRQQGQQVPSTYYNTLTRWRRQWEWERRSELYDAWNRDRRERERRELEKQYDQMWMERSRANREDLYQLGESLRKATANMLQFLETWAVKESREVDPITGTITITRLVRPNVSMNHLAQAAVAAAELTGRSIGDAGDATDSFGPVRIREVRVNLIGAGDDEEFADQWGRDENGNQIIDIKPSKNGQDGED